MPRNPVDAAALEPGVAEPRPAPIRTEALDALRRTLQDAIDDLQRAIEEIGELTRDATGS